MQPVAARAGSPAVTVPASLDEAALLVAVHELAGRDRLLGAVVGRYGPPPLWARPAGFPTLVLLILEQQVSLASARAAYDRLVAMMGDPPTPDAVLANRHVTARRRTSGGDSPPGSRSGSGS